MANPRRKRAPRRSAPRRHEPAQTAGEVVRQVRVGEPATLLDFIRRQFTEYTPSKVKSLFAARLFCVNGEPVSQFDYPLQPGMEVSLMRRSMNPLAGNRFIRLVYEDPWLVVIDKAPGVLAMQSDHHGFCVKTLLDDYFHKTHKRCTAHLVHRLDRDTSGLMIYAKQIDVQQTLEQHWHSLVTDRRYVAVVSGAIQPPRGTVESWLSDDKFFYTHSSPVDDGGKWAKTHYETVAVGPEYSLVELRLETGRKNQIRVHMQDLGHPVAGDRKYGIEGVDPIDRLALHAIRLNFTHPVTGRPMQFETPLPLAFDELFKPEDWL